MIRWNLRGITTDREAAVLYGVSVAKLRQVVRRNAQRFPAELCIRKNQNEYAFHAAGLFMLSSVLKTPQAVQVSIDIIRELYNFVSN